MSYLSRVSIDVTSVDAEQLAREICADGYREHQQLWKLFESASDVKRDFLFRRERYSGTSFRFYILSERKPYSDNRLWHIETKEFRPVIHTGQQLAFVLRVNPVVTRRDENGKQQRHDVVMDLKHQQQYKELSESDRPAMTQLIQEAGVRWLEARAERYGFSFNKRGVSIEGYTQHISRKRKQKTPIRYSTLDVSGLLTVEDVGLFQQSLQKGIGAAKAFGCGLMLVRKV
ncbi:MAG: type I-E CRISPR-associated protein Cas6/Cse3/CasE [Candidatus Thiodiazotropha sp. LLP2]